MICKHYYYFTELKNDTNNILNRENWDFLRTSSVKGPFSIEKISKNMRKIIKKLKIKVMLIWLKSCVKNY